MNRKTIIATLALLITALLLTAAAFGKPQSYCNISRAKLMAKRSARAAKQQDGAQTATIEINGKGFDPASLKLKAGGGLAGHNGLRSIKAHLHSDAFLRVRIGVGKPVSKDRGVDHVLKKFSKAERTEIDVTLELAADAVEAIAAEGIEPAMNRFNTAPP